MALPRCQWRAITANCDVGVLGPDILAVPVRPQPRCRLLRLYRQPDVIGVQCPSIDTFRAGPKCQSAYSPQLKAVTSRPSLPLSDSPATTSGAYELMPGLAITIQRGIACIHKADITVSVTNPASINGRHTTSARLSFSSGQVRDRSATAAKTKIGPSRRTRAEPNARPASATAVASDGDPRRATETTVVVAAIDHTAIGTTPARHIGCHSAVSARSSRTVSARNTHRLTPYGLSSVAARLAMPTRSSWPRSSRHWMNATAVHTTTSPPPTIQPPCRFAQIANTSGNHQSARRDSDVKIRHTAKTPSSVHNCGRSLSSRGKVPTMAIPTPTLRIETVRDVTHVQDVETESDMAPEIRIGVHADHRHCGEEKYGKTERNCER